MEAQESVKDQLEAPTITAPLKVSLSDRDLKIMWGLISTREWPVSMIPEISHIKNVVSSALKVASDGQD